MTLQCGIQFENFCPVYAMRAAGHQPVLAFEGNTMRIDTAIADVTAKLQQVSESPRLDAELLLARSIDVARSYLYAHPEDTLDDAAIARLYEAVQRRVDREPVAYITGTKEFWSLPLMVTPATLVPRPETELLVELTLQRIPRRAEMRVLDLGTGSGAIALAIASERPACQVTATDISADALAVAAQNVRQLELSNVTLLQGSWVEPVKGQTFDLIVSNPPYVSDDDAALACLPHEPGVALSSGHDGLAAIREIAATSLQLMLKDGYLLMEHGETQQDVVAALFLDLGWRDIECHKDHAGKARVVAARK